MVKDILNGDYRGGFIVATFPDRILRWGLPLFNQIAEYGGCEVVFINEGEEDKDDTQSLADDVLSIITIFSARKHGKRAAETTTKTLTPECVKRMGELEKTNLDLTNIHKVIVQEGYLDNHGEKPSYFLCRKYLKNGHNFDVATGITGEVLGYDLFQSFIKKCCRLTGKVKSVDFRRKYDLFCKELGKVGDAHTTVGEYLNRLGGVQKRKAMGKDGLWD